MSGGELYLTRLRAVRETTAPLLDHPQLLNHFNVDLQKLADVTDALVALITRDYNSIDDIPAHARV
jgi:hypothetical protein